MGFFKTFIKIVAGSTSTLMTLSPIPAVYEVHKNKTIGVASIVPMVSMFANCHMNILFGYLKELYFPLFWTALVGDALSLTYIFVYYRYSHERQTAHKMFLYFGVPLVLMTVYAFVGGFGYTDQSRFQVGDIIGYFGTVATVVLYSSPFEKMRSVVRHKSAVFLNIHMICAGSFNMLMWTIYGLTVDEWLVWGPTLFCFIGGCVQIVLYMMYHPSTHPYDGPIPGVTGPESHVVEMNGGDVQRFSMASQTKNKLESPMYYPVVSPPLQPPQRLPAVAGLEVVATDNSKPGPHGTYV